MFSVVNSVFYGEQYSAVNSPDVQDVPGMQDAVDSVDFVLQ